MLLPLIRKSAPARIINVSSVGQVPIDFDDLQMERHYDPFDAYRRSKLAQIMDTIDLAAELAGSGVTVNCLHPASLMNTKMVLEWFGHTMSTIEDGVSSLMNMATSPEFDEITGAYFDQTNRSRPNQQAGDAAARKRLNELSLALTGLAGR
jgi:NAD(P)-dependent dehydrogenase (short-subunit alcohol dehydrogenase family)